MKFPFKGGGKLSMLSWRQLLGRERRLLIRFLFSNLFPVRVPSCQYLIICRDSDRAYSYEGLAYSQLLDTLRDNLIFHGISVATVAAPWSIKGAAKATGNPVLVNGPYARNIVLSKIESVCAGYIFEYRVAERMMRWWTFTLRKLRPSVIIGIQPSESICVAGKKLGIPVYDLQHGVIYCENDSSSYYSDRLRTMFKGEGTPDLVVCWNDQSARVIESMWPWTRAVVVGNPWLQRFVTPEEDSLAMHEINLLRQRLSSCLDKKIVLITTQSIPSLDRIDIPASIKDAILLSSSKGVQWLIKFHPVEVSQHGQERLALMAAEALGEAVWGNIVDVSSHALPAILTFTSYHVTGYSASTFEASAFGIKTGLWDKRPAVANYFSFELSNGFAEFLPAEGGQISKRIIDEISFMSINPFLLVERDTSMI